MQARTGLPRQQGRGQVQHAALPRLAVNGLGLIDGQLALVVALDPLRSGQVDGAEAQRQPVHRHRSGDRHPVLVAQHDAVGDQVQRAQARSRAASDRRPRLTGNDGRAVARPLGAQNAVPDQGPGRDLGHVAGRARAIEGGRVQHQLKGRNAGDGVTGVQADGAVEVDRLAGRQDQALQLGRAGALVAGHQTVQHRLVQGDARRQDAIRARGGQGLAGPDVHRARREGQITRAIVDVLAQADRARGDEAERAVGIKGGAVLDRDHAGGARRGVAGELQQAVRHGQQVHVVGPQGVAHGRVEGGVALAQGRDPGAVLHQNVSVAIGDQQDLRPLQNRSLAHGDAAEPTGAEVALVRPGAAGHHLNLGRLTGGEDAVRHTAQGHDPGADRIQVGGVERQVAVARLRRAVRQDFQRVLVAVVVVAADHGQRAADAALGRIEQTLALEREGRTILVRIRRQGEDEGLAVFRQEGQRTVE
ncbi:hypothetical protein D3C72_542850 [compost metagenome]